MTSITPSLFLFPFCDPEHFLQIKTNDNTLQQNYINHLTVDYIRTYIVYNQFKCSVLISCDQQVLHVNVHFSPRFLVFDALIFYQNNDFHHNNFSYLYTGLIAWLWRIEGCLGVGIFVIINSAGKTNYLIKPKCSDYLGE